MNENLFKDIKDSKSVTIIGASVISSSTFRKTLGDALFDETEKGNKKCIVVAESDNQLFQMSLLTDVQRDNRLSFEELITMRKFFFNEFERKEGRKANSIVRISSLTLPFFAIQTEQSIWYLPINDFDADHYFIVKEGDGLYASVVEYIKLLTDGLLIDKELAALTVDQKLVHSENKYLAPPHVELLELFDQNTVPRGIFPRDTFYDTDHYQYVVWGLVFNREGKLLIHKRKSNAKDNQDMWDKSVGGHYDYTKEKSTSDGMIRELIEELFTKEQKEQTGHGFSMLTDNKESAYYLGDWRLEDYGPYYLDHIALLESQKEQGEENWVMYKYPLSFTHNTPRLLPNGKERRLRVMVDVFFIITNTVVKENYIKEHFQNSDYLLAEPNKLKTWVDNGLGGDGNVFKVTPDLKYIMTGKLRDVINEVSTTIKFSNIRK
jgi:isopentenyldiphosphate isomerase